MATIGTDCHITLQHPSVNGGSAAGFLLWRPDAHGGDVEVTRTGFVLPTGALDSAVKIVVPIVTADTLINPNGARRGAVRAAEYLLYTQYLAAGSGISLAIPGHTFSGLYALGGSKEKHYTSRDELTMVLTNGRLAKEWAPESSEVVRSAGDIDFTANVVYADLTGLGLTVFLSGTCYSAWLNGNVRITGPTYADLRIIDNGVEVSTVRVSNAVAGETVFPVLLSVRVTDAALGLHTLQVQGKFASLAGTSALLEGGSPGHAVARLSAVNW